jgi:ParB-like chromosome segregation protein Spo0J
MFNPDENHKKDMTLEPHALAEMFPPMDADRLQELAADIKKNGQILPVVLLDGKILDGRSRYIASRMAGREPATVDFNAAEYNRSPLEFVFSMNIQRRDLTPSQRAALAADLAEMFRRGNVRDQRGKFTTTVEPDGERPAKPAARAAETMGVSQDYTEDAIKLKKQDPEAFKEVKAGKKTLRQATRSKREKSERAKKSSEAETALGQISSIIGEEARGLIESDQVRLKPKQLVSFANQPPATMKAIWPLLAQGIPYTDAIKSTGGAVLTLSSTLDHFTAKWVEECGTRKENKVLWVSIDLWRFSVERGPG